MELLRWFWIEIWALVWKDNRTFSLQMMVSADLHDGYESFASCFEHSDLLLFMRVDAYNPQVIAAILRHFGILRKFCQFVESGYTKCKDACNMFSSETWLTEYHLKHTAMCWWFCNYCQSLAASAVNRPQLLSIWGWAVCIQCTAIHAQMVHEHSLGNLKRAGLQTELVFVCSRSNSDRETMRASLYSSGRRRILDLRLGSVCPPEKYSSPRFESHSFVA